MEDFYKDEITALCTVEDDAKDGKFSQTSTPASSVPPGIAAMASGGAAAGGLINIGGVMLPESALGAAMGIPFQQAPNANNILFSYLQQNALQQQQQSLGPAGNSNPLLMSLLLQQQQQQQQMQQQQQQVRILDGTYKCDASYAAAS
jgi:hypothetical protein